MSKGVRLKPEQIVAKLREIEVKIGQGKVVTLICRAHGANWLSGGLPQFKICLSRPHHITIPQILFGSLQRRVEP